MKKKIYRSLMVLSVLPFPVIEESGVQWWGLPNWFPLLIIQNCQIMLNYISAYTCQVWMPGAFEIKLN